MTTMKDIAKRAGVSVATVSYVLNNSRPISKEVKDKIMLAVEELHYVPNAIARNLRYRETKTLALIITDITNPFFPELAKACDDVAQHFGYTLIIINTNEQELKTKNALFQVRNRKVDGLIVASSQFSDKSYLQELVKEDYPLVLVHRNVPEIGVDYVGADNRTGAYEAIQHLMHLGHQRIGIVHGNENASVVADRLQGYEEAMKDAGIFIQNAWRMSGGHDYSSSYESSIMMLSIPAMDRPTAILATSDIAALGVMDAAHDLGIPIPGQLSVIGFDDLFISPSRNIQLSTIRIPRYTMGQKATKLLIDRIEGKSLFRARNEILPVELIVRKTCGSKLMK